MNPTGEDDVVDEMIPMRGLACNILLQLAFSVTLFKGPSSEGPLAIRDQSLCPEFLSRCAAGLNRDKDCPNEPVIPIVHRACCPIRLFSVLYLCSSRICKEVNYVRMQATTSSQIVL